VVLQQVLTQQVLVKQIVKSRFPKAGYVKQGIRRRFKCRCEQEVLNSFWASLTLVH
jgi:hypothetical protein